MVNDLLKRAVSNAFRHGLNLKPGKLNSADGNCVWESITYNMLYRECFKRKTKETSKQLRTRSLDLAQSESQWLPFIELNDDNPILMGYNGIHFESLETLSKEDEKRAKELVQLIKSKNHKLNKTHVQNMARVSYNKAVATKVKRDKAKVTQGEYGEHKFRHKCQLCNCSYEAKIDLTQHNAKVHAQKHCIICKEQK